MGKKVDVKDFVTEAFDYLNILGEVSIGRSVNRYLLEYIANGFAKYGETPEQFIDNVDEWIRMLVKIYPEIGFDHKTRQIKAVIDYVDQLIIVDDDLVESLRYIINIQKKYGLLIKYSAKGDNPQTTTLSRFFEYIERMYPVIKDRYKGLGSSAAIVSKEVIMDPRTRRLVRVTMDDDAFKTLNMLVGDGKEDKANRKEMLMNFKFTMDMIDN
jgi:hypothetical protein